MRTTLFFLCLVTAGCSGSGDDDDTGSPTPVTTPSFAADVIPILDAQCGSLDVSCHARDAYAASSSNDCRGWLSLENASIGSQIYAGATAGDPTGCPDRPLYERLTAAGLSDAWECGPPALPSEAKVPYVVPGDPAASYLWRKINGGPYCGMPSDPMPPTGALDAATRDVIYRWILGGALP